MVQFANNHEIFNCDLKALDKPSTMLFVIFYIYILYIYVIFKSRLGSPLHYQYFIIKEKEGDTGVEG